MGRSILGGTAVLHPGPSTVEPCPSEADLLAAEVDDLRAIHALSLRLTDADTLADVLLDVLRTAAMLVDARLGTVQLLTGEGKLGMIGQIGFGESVLDKFASVSLEDCSTCAVALKSKSRIAVCDLRTDRDFTDIAAALCSYGAVAVVSTPVLDRTGNVIAMFSVYWLEKHDPSDRELRALDLCAELAGRHVERSIAADTLREHDQRKTLLMRELAHRGKNLLSVIQAIATRSLSGERTLDEARAVFFGRLEALANTYNTLTEQAPERAQLHDIVVAGLRSLGERAIVRGPVVVVPARTAQTLSLVVHELVTNAAKYGALSVPSGRVEATWEIVKTEDGEDRFVFHWLEQDGPPVASPVRRGFGSTIITSVVGKELNSSTTTEFSKDGFKYRLECSFCDLSGHPPA